MNFEWHDGVGSLGVTLILLAYLLLQLNRIKAEALSYSLMNWIGAALVLASLSHEFNLAAAVLEGVWLLISSAGIAAWFVRRHNTVLSAMLDEHDLTS